VSFWGTKMTGGVFVKRRTCCVKLREFDDCLTGIGEDKGFRQLGVQG
jgi:hypothetical protein